MCTFSRMPSSLRIHRNPPYSSSISIFFDFAIFFHRSPIRSLTMSLWSLISFSLFKKASLLHQKLFLNFSKATSLFGKFYSLTHTRRHPRPVPQSQTVEEVHDSLKKILKEREGESFRTSKEVRKHIECTSDVHGKSQ